jgi:Tol biopolymer transport system component
MNRFSLTRFDVTVLIVALGLIAAITAVTVTGIEGRGEPRVAFLRADAAGIANLWLVDPADPDDAEQLTASQFGIFDYAPGPRGRYIAYTERDFQSGNADIYLLDLRTGDVEQVTDCINQDADCTGPVWHPDGDLIAYQRIDLNTDFGMPSSPNRVWLLDIAASPTTTRPLIDDSQVIGYAPVFSPDGAHLAFYDPTNRGIIIYNFDAPPEDALFFVPSESGEVGAFSPDGNRMIYTEILTGGEFVRAYLQVADLASRETNVLTTADEGASDQGAVWSPNGNVIALQRKYYDNERFTVGHQVYVIDARDGDIAPLLVDERYNHGALSWSPEGDALLMGRFAMLDESGNPSGTGALEVWTYDMETRRLRQITADGYLPAWVP